MTISLIGKGHSHRMKGMTLIEILTSVAILSIGIMIVFQPLLSSVSALNYADSRMEADFLLSRQIWEIQNEALVNGKLSKKSASETLFGAKRPFQYAMNAVSLSDQKSFHLIKMKLSWLESGRSKSLEKMFYLFNQSKT